MKHFFVLAAFFVALVTLGYQAVLGQSTSAFSPYVGADGTISIPKDFRSWHFLGTWGVATDEENQVGSKGFHNVYTQAETVAAFRSTGKFPDGAVLVNGRPRSSWRS